MASIIIRQLDDALKERLRSQAARHGRSMEEEARDILRSALHEGLQAPANLADAIRARFEPLGGGELTPLQHEPIRNPFDEQR